MKLNQNLYTIYFNDAHIYISNDFVFPLLFYILIFLGIFCFFFLHISWYIDILSGLYTPFTFTWIDMSILIFIRKIVALSSIHVNYDSIDSVEKYRCIIQHEIKHFITYINYQKHLVQRNEILLTYVYHQLLVWLQRQKLFGSRHICWNNIEYDNIIISKKNIKMWKKIIIENLHLHIIRTCFSRRNWKCIYNSMILLLPSIISTN